MPIGPSIHPSFLIDPKQRSPTGHALPWAVPQSGRVFENKECRYCGSTGTYRSISIGTLHANCRKFMCARKARR